MQLYQKLSKVGFLSKSYAFKFLFVAFIGIHIPLIGILFLVLFTESSASPMMILMLALALTLLATAITLVVLKKLIRPIELSSIALKDYRKHRYVPLLPIEYKDEAGLLMRHILETVQDNEKFINEKQDLMYLLSHDLRTFTGNSQALAKLIVEEKANPMVTEYGELIYQSTSQQLHFIESFLKMLKIQDEVQNGSDEKQSIFFENIDAVVSAQVKQQLKLKNIRLTADIDIAEKPLFIKRELLVRVLVNLVDNAIKFSFPDSEIRMHYFMRNDKLVISITDYGLGFDPKQSDVLFRKFTPHKKAGTANEPSTGIGLYLCKTIVEKYDGRLTATSEGANRGATFLLTFG